MGEVLGRLQAQKWLFDLHNITSQQTPVSAWGFPSGGGFETHGSDCPHNPGMGCSKLDDCHPKIHDVIAVPRAAAPVSQCWSCLSFPRSPSAPAHSNSSNRNILCCDHRALPPWMCNWAHPSVNNVHSWVSRPGRPLCCPGPAEDPWLSALAGEAIPCSNHGGTSPDGHQQLLAHL